MALFKFEHHDTSAEAAFQIQSPRHLGYKVRADQSWTQFLQKENSPLCMTFISTVPPRFLYLLRPPVSPLLVSRKLSCSISRKEEPGTLTGSAKLFADAQREEAEELAKESQRKSSQLPFLENQHANWDGEESMQDAVLRMLVDKYTPLRGGTIRTAEEKLKQSPPVIQMNAGQSNISALPTSNWETMAKEPLLAAVEGHRPWLTTYKVPSHVTTSIRAGKMPPPVSSRTRTSIDDRARRKEKELKKRHDDVGRLTKAKESTLDYRLGIKNKTQGIPMQARPNPVSLRGWTSLIEDKIEVCIILV